MSDLGDAVDKVSGAVGEVKDATVNGIQDVWNTFTNPKMLLLAGGATFGLLCLTSGGLAAGAASFGSLTVSTADAAFITLAETCSSLLPFTTEATASALAVPGL